MEKPAAGPLTPASDPGEREFREVADNAPVMIWRARPDKLCDWFNKPWRDFSGKTIEQLVGSGWSEDVHSADLQRRVAVYETAFDGREPFTMPYRLKRHDGEYRWFLDNGAPFWRDGRFAGYFGSCVDVTEQRASEDHQRAQLAEVNHRAKNNLQLTISFLQLSKNKAKGEEAKNLLQDSIGRIYGIGAVQEQLRGDLGGMADLGEYLPALARTILDAQSEGTAVLAVETQSILVPLFQASNLGLIVNELVTNAVKHGGGKGGTVALNIARLDGNTAEITVRDTGPGFSGQVPDGTSGGARGRGIVDVLARRARATLTRESDDGARVRVTFPLGQPEG